MSANTYVSLSLVGLKCTCFANTPLGPCTQLQKPRKSKCSKFFLFLNYKNCHFLACCRRMKLSQLLSKWVIHLKACETSKALHFMRKIWIKLNEDSDNYMKIGSKIPVLHKFVEKVLGNELIREQ